MLVMKPNQVICGIDTHADTHAAAVADHHGRLLDVNTFPVTAAGYRELSAWCARYGRLVYAGVEGTSSYGKGITAFLADQGVTVLEVARPNRQVRRLNGKSDPTDAISAYRAVLSGEATAVPKTGNGPVEAIRVLHTTRVSAVKARTEALNQIRDLVRTASQPLREQLQGLTTTQRIRNCSRFRTLTHATTADQATRQALRHLARRCQQLTEEIEELTTQLDQLTQQTAPRLRALPGVGPDTAAKLLITTGDNPHRIRSDAAFAKICGAAPLDASSGKQQRHRLNRGGYRQANNALYTITIVRMRHDPKTRAYVEKRIKEGKTKPEIIRCLKRHIARQIHKTIKQDLPQFV